MCQLHCETGVGQLTEGDGGSGVKRGRGRIWCLANEVSMIVLHACESLSNQVLFFWFFFYSHVRKDIRHKKVKMLTGFRRTGFLLIFLVLLFFFFLPLLPLFVYFFFPVAFSLTPRPVAYTIPQICWATIEFLLRGVAYGLLKE